MSLVAASIAKPALCIQHGFRGRRVMYARVKVVVSEGKKSHAFSNDLILASTVALNLNDTHTRPSN